ncbi:MAG TPA: hypothetical protein VFK96_10185 [Gammaproteobacteria bacterium]|nr:hypothetical protein [Gammaproteobacteria bacterium]
MKKSSVFAAMALSLAALSFTALAGNNSVKQQVMTAHAHALMAAGASSLKMTHAHLHHVINCLVGPSGAAFDSSAADPCKGMGSGALPDAAGQSKLHSALKKALATARAGVKDDNLKTAQRSAHKAALELQKAAASVKSG